MSYDPIPTVITMTDPNGNLLPAARAAIVNANVAGGIATFYLTDNGQVSGNALFKSVIVPVFPTSNVTDQNLIIGNFVVSGDKKTITATVNKAGTIILGLIQIISAADGIPISLLVFGA